MSVTRFNDNPDFVKIAILSHQRNLLCLPRQESFFFCLRGNQMILSIRTAAVQLMTVQLYRILKARYNQIKYKLMKEAVK